MVEGGGKRKRNSEDSPTSTPSSLQPSLKKLKTNASSPATPTSAATSASNDMEFTIDVQILREHKRNLVLKLNELRRECDSLKAKKIHAERERDHNSKVLGHVARQWNNLHSDLLQMAKRLGSSETNAASTTTSASSSSSTTSFVQKLLQDYDSTVSDEDEQKIINALNLRCDKTKKLLENVLDSILVERLRNDEIIKKIKEETGHHKRDASLYTLREDNNKLKAKTEENEKNLGEYQLKNKQLGNQLDVCKDKLMIVSQENEQLNSELSALKEELNLVQRRYERLKSEGRVVKTEESQPAQIVVKTEGVVVPQTELGEKVKSLEEEVTSLKSQIVTAQQEKLLLQYKLETEEGVKQSSLYQYLYQQYLSLINCIKSEMGKNEANNAKIAELLKEKKQILDQKEDEFKKLRESYDKQLTQKEQEKADLSSKLQRSNENTKQEIDSSVWQKRADELKKQYKNLQEELKIAKKDKQEIIADFETMRGKLSTRNKEIEGTKKRIKELSKIVDSYKSLQQEKRELAEVRGKEMFYRDRVKKLEEEVKQLKTTEQGQLVQKHNEEMQEKKDELAFLKSEVDKLTATIDEYETKISQHEEELRKKEDESANISKEKFQLQRQLNAMTQTKNLLEHKIKAMEEKFTRMDEERNAMVAKLKSMDDVEKQHQAVHSQMKKEIDKLKSDLLLANLKYNEIKVEYDKVSVAGKDALLRHEEQQLALGQLEKKLKEREDLISLLEQKLGAHKSEGSSSSGAVSALEDELRMWKTVALCSQCDRRQKNCVITKCFHSFCKECVQANLQVRNRKCPRCKANYGQQDVKDLFL